ncbi:hypothetical protein M9458_027011, partial [Cirrhinus mrigala]
SLDLHARTVAPDFSELLKKRAIEMGLKKDVSPEKTQEIPLTQPKQDTGPADTTISAPPPLPPPLPPRPSSGEAGEPKPHAIMGEGHETKSPPPTPPPTPSTAKVTTTNTEPTPAAPETTVTPHQQESKDDTISTNHVSACT